MSAILLAIIGWDPKGWDQLFRTLAPQHDIRLWPENIGNPADVAYACVWKPPHGMLRDIPNLKAIFSLGAGVDDLLADPQLPNVPVVRIVDADLTMRMTEYVVLHVLMYHRQHRLYDAQQRVRMWHDHEQPPASEVAVGIMGLGELGRAAAVALQRLGFRVVGWSRTQKSIPAIESFYGSVGLEPFLRRTEILVCLLPSTPSTRGILNLDLFRRLKFNGALHGAYLINAARGDLQVDADIIAALEDGTLSGATLDVFPTEPLPITSPFWTHPKVTITPHNAAQSSPRAHRRPTSCGRSTGSRSACRSSTWSTAAAAIEPMPSIRPDARQSRMPAARMRATASAIGSIATAMWWPLAVNERRWSRAMATWPFQNRHRRGLRLEKSAAGVSGSASDCSCMSLSRGQGVPLAVSASCTSRRAVEPEAGLATP